MTVTSKIPDKKLDNGNNYMPRGTIQWAIGILAVGLIGLAGYTVGAKESTDKAIEASKEALSNRVLLHEQIPGHPVMIKAQEHNEQQFADIKAQNGKLATEVESIKKKVTEINTSQQVFQAEAKRDLETIKKAVEK